MKKIYTITYYSDAVWDDINSWPLSLRTRYTQLTQRMEIYGSHLGNEHTKAFGRGLFELRVKGKDGIGRAFFCTKIGKEIVILHGFIKKTQKTPQREIDVALSRMREVKND